MPRLNKADNELMEEFNFEFSAPPAKSSTRRGRHQERWEAARVVCEKFPGQSLKVMEYATPSSAYNTAKAINNGEHGVFKNDSQDWKAVARHLPPYEDEEGNEVTSTHFGVWLTYEPHEGE